MLVSIIVPNYNYARFLDERLDSIFNQTYKNFELIILDDYSDDDSVNLINKYKNHPKLKTIILNKKNSGNPIKQWELGIKHSSGKLIWIAESDDSSSPYFLEKMVHYFSDDKNLIIANCNSFLINEHNKKTGVAKWHIQESKKFNHSIVSDGKTALKNHFSNRCMILNVSSAIFKKSAVDELMPLSHDFKHCGDWYFYVSLLKNNPNKNYLYLSTKLNFFRVHQTSLTHRKKNIESNITRINEYLNIIKISGKEASIKTHSWIVKEWIKKSIFLWDNKSYWNPPFPVKMKIFFILIFIPFFLFSVLLKIFNKIINKNG